MDSREHSVQPNSLVNWGLAHPTLIYPLKWLAEMTCADLETGWGPEGRWCTKWEGGGGACAWVPLRAPPDSDIIGEVVNSAPPPALLSEQY